MVPSSITFTDDTFPLSLDDSAGTALNGELMTVFFWKNHPKLK
jgi:hypothetical protein